MIEFIVRARAAPVDPDHFLEAIGAGIGVEYLADIIRDSLFVSQAHREDTIVTLVLEKSRDFSRVIRLNGANLGALPDLHERSLLGVIADALRAGRNLEKDAAVTDARGIEIIATSFEHLVRERVALQPVYLLDKGGTDVRETELSKDVVFVLTDHTPMPKNTYKSMARQGVLKLSLGPHMLHAAQCISIIHNERDRQATI